LKFSTQREQHILVIKMKRDKWNGNLQIIPVYVRLVFTVVLIQGDFEGCADI
jgi:hypothetical protein